MEALFPSSHILTIILQTPSRKQLSKDSFILDVKWRKSQVIDWCPLYCICNEQLCSCSFRVVYLWETVWKQITGARSSAGRFPELNPSGSSPLEQLFSNVPWGGKEEMAFLSLQFPWNCSLPISPLPFPDFSPDQFPGQQSSQGEGMWNILWLVINGSSSPRKAVVVWDGCSLFEWELWDLQLLGGSRW